VDESDPSARTPTERLRERTAELAAWASDNLPGAAAVLETLERERDAGGGLLAGGLAYRFFFWLVPFGLAVGAGLGFWVEADPEAFDEAAHDLGLSDVLASGAADAIDEGRHSRWYLLAVGLFFMTWFSISAARAIRIAASLAWRERPRRMRRALVAGEVFTAAVLSMLAVSLAAAWLREELDLLGDGLTLLAVVLYGAVALWAMALLPHAEAPLRALLPGALLMAFGIQAIHIFVALYLGPRLGRSSELYGTLGAATTILLGLYVTARLLTLATFLNATLWDRRRGARA